MIFLYWGGGMATDEPKITNWVWIGGAAVATFLIASVLPTAILQPAVMLCLDVGVPADICVAPIHGTAELTGSRVTGLTMSMTTTAKIVLSLIVAGVTALVMGRKPT